MAALSNYVQYTTSHGQPVKNGDVVVTPISRALVVQLPFYTYVWNRPVAVKVENGTSSTQLAIVDVTMFVQIALLALGSAAAVIVMLAGQRSNGKK